jgi:prepilin-type N-terminal cleavage/methylation domain-containing protein/prepilin-type processing-associated H-X9-DG protein
MKRRGLTLFELIVVLAIILVLVMAFYPNVNHSRHNARRAACQSNLKQIALGVLQYTQNWDEKFPIVSVRDVAIDENNPLGWADAILPYVKSQQLFWCPAQIQNGIRDGNEKQPADRDYTDYFYNRRLAGAEIKDLKNPIWTVLCGEGNDGTDAANARYSLSGLPTAWIKDEKSPLYRHLNGANYLFNDGHVKWLPPARITGKKRDGSTPVFTIN